MSHNIYDDPEFLAGYARLPRSVDGLDGAPEWPRLRAMLPPVVGTRVLDLGCGFGWFCRWAAEQGAASILGLDGSQQMLARARAGSEQGARTGTGPRIAYRHQDLDVLDVDEVAPDPFQVVCSSLTLHYLTDLASLMEKVHELLVPGGAFVFSVEHPIFSAPSQPAFVADDGGAMTWPLDGYFVEGPRTTSWFVDGVVKQHRTVGTYLTSLLAAGLQVTHVDEWGPSPDDLTANPDWVDEQHRPLFLLVGAKRPA